MKFLKDVARRTRRIDSLPLFALKAPAFLRPEKPRVVKAARPDAVRYRLVRGVVITVKPVETAAAA